VKTTINKEANEPDHQHSCTTTDNYTQQQQQHMNTL